MKKELIATAIAFLMLSAAWTQDLEWYSWDEGFSIAKKENKTMVIFIQASWCHWCKRMEAKTYNEENVRTKIRTDFINIKFDAESDSSFVFGDKTFSGMELLSEISAGKFRAIPATLFMNPGSGKAELVGGFREPDAFLSILADHVSM